MFMTGFIATIMMIIWTLFKGGLGRERAEKERLEKEKADKAAEEAARKANENPALEAI